MSEEFISGKGKASKLPLELKGWNWGAFFGNWLWGIRHKSYIGLCVFIPIIGFIFPFILGFRGNEYAWRNIEWESIDEFKETQKKWLKYGLLVFLLTLSSIFIFFLYMMRGEAYYLSLEKIEKHPFLYSELKGKINAGYFIGGSVETNPTKGRAEISYSVSGMSNKSFDIHVNADKINGIWGLNYIVAVNEENNKMYLLYSKFMEEKKIANNYKTSMIIFTSNNNFNAFNSTEGLFSAQEELTKNCNIFKNKNNISNDCILYNYSN